MVVTPPHAAAAVPDSKSSAVRMPPSSRSRCVWTSTPPGMTTRPRASISCALAGNPASMVAIRPPRMPRSATTTSEAVATRPPRTTRSYVIMHGASQLHQSGHDQRDPRDEGDDQQAEQQRDDVRDIGTRRGLDARATERAGDEEPDAERRHEEPEPERGDDEDAVVQGIEAEAGDDGKEDGHEDDHGGHALENRAQRHEHDDGHQQHERRVGRKPEQDARDQPRDPLSGEDP